MSETTGTRFLHSTVASYLSLGTRLVIRFASRMILARLVLPEGHGLYELALRLVILASAVRDLGLNFHLMRDRRRPYGTVFAFTTGQGILVTGALFLLAPATAGLDPDLPLVLRVLSFWILLDGLSMVPKIYFERELRIGRVALPEIGRGLAMAAISIGLAWKGWGVWSFVVGELVAASLFAVLVWIRAWGSMPLEIHFRLIPDLLGQSRWLLSVWVALQAVEYVDIYILELVTLDTALVGQYFRAYEIALIIPMIVFPRALLPALVEVRDDPDRFLTAFRFGTLFLLSFQVVGGYFLFFHADKVVRILLGTRWSEAAGLLKILCFVPFLDVFKELGGEILKVKHQDRAWLAIALVNLLCLLVFGSLFTAFWGARGMAFANLLLLGNYLMARRMARIFGPGFRRLAKDLVFVYLIPLPCFLLARWLASPETWVGFGAGIVAAAVAFGLLARLYWRPFQRFLAEE
ncbi:MAG: oligosaccharide flippase family protein [Thermoanaerobaculia bacterium]|nr:oligosaccharide flippase family protein [Thermoanaerobaculia bacterium]